jgi:hypothetical protein
VAPYCLGHELHPFALLFAIEYFLDCHKNQGVGSLNCSVVLQVVYKCEGHLHPYQVTEILERGTIKLLGIVNGDLPRNSVATDDVLPEIPWTVVEVVLVTGFALTPLVKYSTSMMSKV